MPLSGICTNVVEALKAFIANGEFTGLATTKKAAPFGATFLQRGGSGGKLRRVALMPL
jgi:DNA polymerase/3'-5' exonuclease PolX